MKSNIIQGKSGNINFKFILYLLFTASYFLHLPNRFPILGKVRSDVLLAGSIIVLIILESLKVNDTAKRDKISRSLYYLIVYIILSLPFVEWPGSVIRQNFYIFLKAVVFFSLQPGQ